MKKKINIDLLETYLRVFLKCDFCNEKIKYKEKMIILESVRTEDFGKRAFFHNKCFKKIYKETPKNY